MIKFYKISGIILILLFTLLLLAPFILKPRVIKILKEEANNYELAKIDFNKDISISFFSSFPDLNIGVEDFSIIGKNDFEGDTLFATNELNFSVDIKEIIGNERANIKFIELNQPFVNLKVNADGKANWDIIPSDTSDFEDSSSLSFGLEKIEIENARFVYNDIPLLYSTSIDDLDIVASGDLESDNFELEAELNGENFQMSYHHLPIFTGVLANLNVIMDMDMKNMKFAFKKGEAIINDLEIESTGFVQLNEEDMDFDMKFTSPNTAFKNILSIVPAIYAKDFNKIDTKGSMAFSGFLRGKMTDELYPAFNFSAQIADGYFKYPELSHAVRNINLNLEVDNRDGNLNHTVINLRNFVASIFQETIELNALIKSPISDPYLDAKVKGALDLSRVKEFYPLKEDELYQGKVETNLAFQSFLSYVETEQYDKVKASGFFNGENIKIDAEGLQDPLEINTIKMDFKPTKFSINTLEGNFGKSDFSVKGGVENIVTFLFLDSALKGDLSIKSDYLNLNPFLTEESVTQIEEPAASDTVSMVYLDIPANLNFDFKADVLTLIYDNLKIEKAHGEASVSNKVLYMRNVSGELLGGAFSMPKGSYDATNPQNPFSAVDFSLNNVDIKQTVAYFGFMEKLSPILNFANGLFSFSFDMGTELQSNLSPNYKTFNGTGRAVISAAQVKGITTLNKVGEVLKIPILENIKVKDLEIGFKVVNGDFALLDSLILPIYKGIKVNLTGTSSLEGKLKYFARFDIPRDLFGEVNTSLNGMLERSKARGFNIDISKFVPVDVSINGMFGNPIIDVQLAETKKNMVDNVKDQFKKEVNKKVDEGKELTKAKLNAEKERARQRAQDSINKVKEAARARAEKLVNEAEARASVIKAEARRTAAANKQRVYQQADSIEQKGTSPLEKLASRKAADKMKQQADKREIQFVEEADKRADAIVNKAKEQAARLEGI